MQRDIASLVDILVAARLIQEFLTGVERGEFCEDALRQAAVVREFEIIGEAAKRVSDGFRDAHPEIPWKRMAGMRDILIHAYDHVDVDEVWYVAQTSVPELIRLIEPLVPAEGEV